MKGALNWAALTYGNISWIACSLISAWSFRMFFSLQESQASRTISSLVNRSATHEEVVRAAKSACCHDFIMALPSGYDTVIGESGATLSGGEKQRISIARAILKDTPIIILDEATSSVDPENEAELQQAIEKLTEDKTVTIIAHRLKTVRNAQQIVVIANGGIAQRGTHRELMTQPGIYAEFSKY